MADPRTAQLSRRTLLYGGTLAPIALFVGSSGAAWGAEPTETITALRVDGSPGFEVASSDGGLLADGVYTFMVSGGATPEPGTFVTTRNVAKFVAYGGDSSTWPGKYKRSASSGDPATATVTLPAGHKVTSFSVGMDLTQVADGVDANAVFSAVTPSGAALAMPLFESGPVDDDPVAISGVFGPTGAHWPSRTPRPDDAFDAVVDVDPSWSAIAAAITTAAADHPDGTIKIRVRPGTFPGGNGAGSSNTGVLDGIDLAGRSSRVLVVPRDGWGTVTPAATYASGQAKGYSFVGVSGVALMGFDFLDHTVLVRNCRDFALGWSTSGRLNVTANRADVTDVELVECVIPVAASGDTDTMAFRLANGYSIDGLTMAGCYVAPSYKALGSSGHTDTLQTSRTGAGTHRNLTFRDSVFFQSSSQAVLLADAFGVTVDHVAVLGGLRGTDRYPIGADQYVMTGENALWGNPQDVAVTASAILGSIDADCSFASVADSIASKQTSATIASGSFFVDDTFADRTAAMGDAFCDAHCPLPDSGRLATIWSALG